jgi:hypothetical protein
MISTEEDKKMQAARAISEMIAEFRQECLQAMFNAVVKECTEIVESGYDPARGTGRGPWWADGG